MFLREGGQVDLIDMDDIMPHVYLYLLTYYISNDRDTGLVLVLGYLKVLNAFYETVYIYFLLAPP